MIRLIKSEELGLEIFTLIYEDERGAWKRRTFLSAQIAVSTALNLFPYLGADQIRIETQTQGV